VLFADVKGSMTLQERLDPERWHAIMERFHRVLAEGVHRFEGTVNDVMGDGIMALFGAPIAHEDHAQRACFAALWLRDALAALSTELRAEQAIALETRIGLNSGEVGIGKIGDDLRTELKPFGHAVSLAQRMEAAAEPGTIYLTDRTASAVEGFFDLVPLGARAVKGVAEPVEVFALEGAGSARTRLDVASAGSRASWGASRSSPPSKLRSIEPCRGADRCWAWSARPGWGRAACVSSSSRPPARGGSPCTRRPARRTRVRSRSSRRSSCCAAGSASRMRMSRRRHAGESTITLPGSKGTSASSSP
jgi:class 3 adenylate cyclase